MDVVDTIIERYPRRPWISRPTTVVASSVVGRGPFQLFASIARERFSGEYWHGPRPRPGTVLDVSTVGDGKRYRVTAERALELVGRDGLG